MTGNNPKLDLVNVDARKKRLVRFCQIHSQDIERVRFCQIHSQDIERKQNSDVNQGP